jgi:capsular polysaccharide export protein
LIIDGLRQFKDKKVLLLQGPVGPFFYRLSKDLTKVGSIVYKINFNGGDLIFYPFRSTYFRKNLSEWPNFIKTFLIKNKIDVVLLFGDCRHIHSVAHEIAHGLNLQIGVFEEGYIRPNYITLEEYGVNGNSRIPKKSYFYETLDIKASPKIEKVGNTFWYAAMWAMIYNFFGMFLSPFFIQYKHHKPLTIWQGLYWLRSFLRKIKSRNYNIRINKDLTDKYSKQFFLVPLQLHNDAQVSNHSNFSSIESFIDLVITSFAKNAPNEKLLVIKIHPFDRGFNDYHDFVKKVARLCGVDDRVLYVDSVHLPDMLKHASGVILINSTVGLSALQYKSPLIALGNAIYNFESITYQNDLDSFWINADHFKSNDLIVGNFIRYLIRTTQINGNYYKKILKSKFYCGLRWRRLTKKVNKSIF